MTATLETNLVSPSTPLEKEIAELGPWFHNLHLPDGTQTAPNHPLGDFPSFKWNAISGMFPRDLSEKRVLDIGCNAGYYTFKLAERGARVTGVDVDEHYLRQANWAAKLLQLKDRVEFRKLQVYNLAGSGKSYDIVLFMGVFYHLRYPILALDIVSELFTDFLVFQTMTMPGREILPRVQDLRIADRAMMLDPGWPKMAFIEDELEGDPTNWWAPNHAGVLAILRSSGLEIFAEPAHEIYFCRTAKKPGYSEEKLSAVQAICNNSVSE